MWGLHSARRTRVLPRRSTVDSVWLNISRSAAALAPSPSPILHHPIFSVSTCGGTKRAASAVPQCRFRALGCGGDAGAEDALSRPTALQNPS